MAPRPGPSTDLPEDVAAESEGSSDPTASGIREALKRALPLEPEQDDLAFETPSEARALFSRPPTAADAARALIEGAAMTDRPSTPPPRINSIKPPVLASECLRNDVAPTEPGKRRLKLLATIALATSVVQVATWWLDRSMFWGLTVIALSAIALWPDDYKRRTTRLAVAGTITIFVNSAVLAMWTHDAVEGVLAIAVPWLAASLLFRAYHRASKLARVLVACGIGLGVIWCALSGWLVPEGGIVAAESDPQRLAKMLLGVTWVGLLLLSSLAFMGPSSKAGANVWATSVLVWYGLSWSAQLIPLSQALDLNSMFLPNMLLSFAVIVLGTAIGATALAQVAVLFSQKQTVK